MELDKLRLSTRIAARLIDDLVFSGRISQETGNLLFDKLTDGLITEDIEMLTELYNEAVDGIRRAG